MVPAISSPSSSFTRMGVPFSINRFRYFASSKVCSGARADFPCGGVLLLLAVFLLTLGRDRDAAPRRAGGTLEFSIIAVARGDPQFGRLQPDLEFVERLLREGD